MTGTATTRLRLKNHSVKSNDQNNNFARASHVLVYFLAVHCTQTINPTFSVQRKFSVYWHLLIGRIREMSLDKKIKFLSCTQGSYLRVFWSSPISRFQILSRNAMPKLRSGTPSLGLLPAKSQSLLFLGQGHEKN